MQILNALRNSTTRAMRTVMAKHCKAHPYIIGIHDKGVDEFW